MPRYRLRATTTDEYGWTIERLNGDEWTEIARRLTEETGRLGLLLLRELTTAVPGLGSMQNALPAGQPLRPLPGNLTAPALPPTTVSSPSARLDCV